MLFSSLIVINCFVTTPSRKDVTSVFTNFVKQRNSIDCINSFDVSQATPLYDEEGCLNAYYIEVNRSSYYIVDSQSMTPLEYNLNSVGPYSSQNNNLCIYCGPMQYGVINQESLTFTNLFSGETKRLDKPFVINSNTSMSIDKSKIATNAITPMATSLTENLIDNYKIINDLKDFTRYDGTGKEYNNNGVCGYVAAAIALYYSKYQFNSNLLASKYIEYVNGQRRFTAELVDKLISIGAENGIGTSTTAFSIKTVMQAYTDLIDVKAGHYAMLLSTPINIMSAL